MNWEAIGAIGEIVGAVLLLGSLVYVGIQIKDTKRQISAAAAQARADGLRDLFKLRMSREFIEAQIKSDTDPTSLTEAERMLLGNWFFLFMSFMQNNYYQRQVGSLETSQSGALDSMPLLTESKLHREMWTRGKVSGAFSEEFIAHVDNLLREKGA